MKKLLLLISGLFTCFSFLLGQKAPKKINGKEIIGYYAGWQVYDREKIAQPNQLNYKKFTTIIYAFFRPDFNGNIKGTDAFIDDFVLKGQRDWRVNGDVAYIPATSLVELAHYKKVKVLISIGGWTGSNQFSQIAADSSKRIHFAEECVRLVKEYGVDGVDIDWEFPCYHGNPADKENFTKLLKTVRTAFDEYESQLKKRKKKHLYLVIATSASKQHAQNIEWKKVLPYVDYINMMSYDFTGSWTPKTAHKSPLYISENANKFEESIDDAVNYYLNVAQVPDSMLNIGTSFNGNALACDEGKVDLNQDYKRVYDRVTFKKDGGQPTYYNILAQQDKFIEKWDSTAKQPYLLGKEINTFITYDNERAVREKVNYVKDKNLYGIFIWDITGDIIETREGSGIIKKTPLLNSIYDEVKK